MADNFITKTSLPETNLVVGSNGPVLSRDAALRDAIAGSATPDLATFFAAPIMGPVDGQGEAQVSWYSDLEGKPRALESLYGPMREDVADRLAMRVAQVDALRKTNPELAPDLDAAMAVMSRGDVLVMGGQPVLINWGARPEGADAAGHFANTFGQLLPRASVQATPFQAAGAAAPVAATAAVTTAAASAAAAAQTPPADDRPRSAAWFSISLAILAVILLAVLIWLALPNTRLFPPEPPALAAEIDNFAADALRANNEELEARISAMRDAIDNGQCQSDGTFLLPYGRTPDGLLPPGSTGDDQANAAPATPDALVPPNPDRVRVPTPGTGDSVTEQSTTSIVDLIERNSVLVVSDNGIGTGFFIAPNVVFTNHHVIEDALGTGRVFVVNEALGTPTSATIIRHDGPFEQTGGDFALLRVDATSPSYFALLGGDVQVKGQGVIAAGYPGDIVMNDVRFEQLMNGTSSEVPDMVVTNGIVNTEQQIATDVSLLIHSASISQGNSGGPLVDLCGRVVGMNTFVSQQALRSLNLAQTTESLLAFLARGEAGEVDVVTGTCEPNVAPVAPNIAPPPEDAPAEDDAPTTEDGARE
ncbi:serine protease [Yoonia sp.]|nr:serine protease [Yoonia sp.]